MASETIVASNESSRRRCFDIFNFLSCSELMGRFFIHRGLPFAAECSGSPIV